MPATSVPLYSLSNAEIARRLSAYAGHLQSQNESFYKVSAYRRAAKVVKSSRERFDDLVRAGADVTRFPGIGKSIAGALREIVFSGKLGQLEMRLEPSAPEQTASNDYPAFDPQQVARVFKRFKISSISELREKLDNGLIARELGSRLANQIRAALRESGEILLDDADTLADEIRLYLIEHCGAGRAEVAGDLRRRVETISSILIVVATDNFPALVKNLIRFRGGIDLIEEVDLEASFQLLGSVKLTVRAATTANWGTVLVVGSGSPGHLEKLQKIGGLKRRARSEADVYRSIGLEWIPPELREGLDEVTLASKRDLPDLIEFSDIRGDLHMHTTGSDGADTIEAMAEAAKERGYAYIGITDHSQSLKIARGMAIDRLWAQIRRIDKLNNRRAGIRILKSAEVDILADGSLDYPNDLLAELDYTICSIHSRFRQGKKDQTERIMRAMDHPSFTILGHATGRKLLQRSGYDLDLPRLITHAKERRCLFEINADPVRLDLSPDNVREVSNAGIKIAIGSDAHRSAALDYMRFGIDVARRAGLEKKNVLNTASLPQLLRYLRRQRVTA